MTDVTDFRRLEEYKQWLRMRILFDRYPLESIRQAGYSHLEQARANVSGQLYGRLLDEWEKALADPTGASLKQLALDPSPYGVTMRQINPLQGVMSEQDRLAVIRKARDEQRAAGRITQRERENHRSVPAATGA